MFYFLLATSLFSGVILYELVTGKMAFRALKLKEVTERVVNVDYWMPDEFSDNLKDLIQKIFVGKSTVVITISRQQLRNRVISIFFMCDCNK